MNAILSDCPSLPVLKTNASGIMRKKLRHHFVVIVLLFPRSRASEMHFSATLGDGHSLLSAART